MYEHSGLALFFQAPNQTAPLKPMRTTLTFDFQLCLITKLHSLLDCQLLKLKKSIAALPCRSSCLLSGQGRLFVSSFGHHVYHGGEQTTIDCERNPVMRFTAQPCPTI